MFLRIAISGTRRMLFGADDGNAVEVEVHPARAQISPMGRPERWRSTSGRAWWLARRCGPSRRDRRAPAPFLGRQARGEATRVQVGTDRGRVCSPDRRIMAGRPTSEVVPGLVEVEVAVSRLSPAVR